MSRPPLIRNTGGRAVYPCLFQIAERAIRCVRKRTRCPRNDMLLPPFVAGFLALALVDCNERLLICWFRKISRDLVPSIRIQENGVIGFLLEIGVIPVMAGTDLNLDRNTPDRVGMVRFDIAVPKVLMKLTRRSGILIYQNGMKMKLARIAVLGHDISVNRRVFNMLNK